MHLDPLVVGLVLVSALIHASWNAAVKADGDRLVTFAMIQTTSMALGAIGLLFVGPLASAAYPYLVVSAIVHYAYYALLLRAYALGDLSHVYPIARGLGPFLVALSSGALAGESLTAIEFGGVGLVSLGIVGLASGRGSLGQAYLKATLAAVATGITIAGYTLADGIGGRVSGDVFAYIMWVNVVEGPGVIAYALWRRGPGPFMRAGPSLWRGALAGTLAAFGYGIAIWAMSVSGLAHVATLRECSVLFAAAIGTFLLGETLGARRIAAAALIVLGLVTMNLLPALLGPAQ